jgi:type VI secretion system protein ImpH
MTAPAPDDRFPARWRAEPWRIDFYQLLRRIEAGSPQLPRLGEARRPADEPLRLGQSPALDFAPAAVDRIADGPGGRPRVSTRFLGVWGPNGAMPVHLTELARERQRSYGDPTLSAFADVFHHRLLLLFYRAWRTAQPTASRDRPAADRFQAYAGALIGAGGSACSGRGAVPDDAKRFRAGHLSRAARSADGLADLLRADLRVPVEVLCFVPDWLELPDDQRSRLGAAGMAELGSSVVLGRRVRDAQHQIEIRVGPLSKARFESFLPGGPSLRRLADWVRTYTHDEYRWRLRLSLRGEQLRPARLGRDGRLGLTTWSAGTRPRAEADDLVLSGETIARATAASAPVPSP